MKVLMINGSPKPKGNTALALEEMKKVFEAQGVEVDYLHVGNKPIRGCIACNHCKEAGKCVFDDEVNAAAEKLRECDGLVVGDPVYYGSAGSTLVAFLTRLFYSTSFSKEMKVGAAVVVARRAGTTAAFDELNKFFTISGMPVASGHYWNNVYGQKPGQAEEDAEGLQNVRQLARNMTFLMKSIALGKETYGLPEHEPRVWTNFIH